MNEWLVERAVGHAAVEKREWPLPKWQRVARRQRPPVEHTAASILETYCAIDARTSRIEHVCVCDCCRFRRHGFTTTRYGSFNYRCDLMDALSSSPPLLGNRLERVRLEGGGRPKRTLNEYVDAPFLPQRGIPQRSFPHRGVPDHHAPVQKTRATDKVHKARAADNNNVPGVVACSAVLQQPRLKKTSPPPPPLPASSSAATTEACTENIYCDRCRRCRCDACTTPRTFPRRWFCSERYECSGKSVVEACSCLCAVRAAFYHGCRESDDDGRSPADAPCSCDGAHCCSRWACMALSSVTCLPCLCAYWPLRCALATTEAVYDRLTRRGCRCHDKASSEGATARRLLLESESSST